MLAKIVALTIGAGLVIAIASPGCAYGCPDGRCGVPPPVDAGADAAHLDGPAPDAPLDAPVTAP